MDLAKSCGAELHLVMVVPDYGTLSGAATVTSKFLPGTTAMMLEIAVQNAGEYLAQRRETLRGQGFAADAHVLRGDPATAIADAAERLGADLIALATHGKLGLNAFWSGSVANKVCSRCPLPLLLIPVEPN
jgi:nucleotide-binding universal stress UspA family protein